MYAGSSFTRISGRIIGAHQKIDRVARHHLGELLDDATGFPSSRKILQFEGRNGPDALKRKSPAQDEPWHFFNPFDAADTQLQKQIDSHYHLLAEELRNGNKERSAFEAAWLAHAIADGLTPAHQYPYEAKLAELRGGQGNETRTSIKAKLVMPGNTKREQIKNNWLMWGPKGLLTGHTLFEFGIATILAPLSLKDGRPNQADLWQLEKDGFIKVFETSARTIAHMELYEAYCKSGWTPRLAWNVRHRLGPEVVKTVTLAWYGAAKEAGLA